VADNKVVFGLKNVHFSVISEDETTGAIVYGTPIALKGAVEISLEPRGETSDFYADDMLYYTTTTNAGYEATLTVANITNDFREMVLGEEIDQTNRVVTENTNQRSNKIAFMFEFDGDQKAVRHCLYNCTVTRPSLTSATKTETAEPQNQELTMVSAPREDGVVKRSTTIDTPPAVYDAWYTAVYEPAPAV
jgi:phi13 family phage major tail protein